MAKSNWGITSGFIGKLGNVVGFNWKGKNIQRAHIVSGRKSQSEDQQLARILIGNGKFDQLIVYPTFIHVSWRRFGWNRKQVLRK